MFYKVQKKELDLLAAYYRKDGTQESSQRLKQIGIPILLIVIFGMAYGLFTLSNISKQNQIQNTKEETEILQLKIESMDQNPYRELTQLQEMYSSLTALDQSLSKLPQITQNKINGARRQLLSGMSLQSITYNQDTNQLTFFITSVDVLKIETYVTSLHKNSDFKDVHYSGYQQVSERTSIPTGQTDETTGQEMTTVQVDSYYTFAVDITLDGGE